MAEQKERTEVEVGGKEKRPSQAESGRMPSMWGQMERDMQRMFDDLMSRRWARPWQWEMPELRLPFEAGLPKVDVIDRDDEILVRAELPGVEKDDVDVSLGDGTVTIKAVTHRESKDEKGEYFRREIATGEVTRTVGLPGDVDSSGAKADFENGMLEVTLPKSAQSRRRQIPIR